MPMKFEFTDGVITHLYNKLTEEIYTLPLGVDYVPTALQVFSGRSGLLKRRRADLSGPTDSTGNSRQGKVAPLKAEMRVSSRTE